jgi:hypothetical protein
MSIDLLLWFVLFGQQRPLKLVCKHQETRAYCGKYRRGPPNYNYFQAENILKGVSLTLKIIQKG